jgi:hypothetical protein
MHPYILMLPGEGNKNPSPPKQSPRGLSGEGKLLCQDPDMSQWWRSLVEHIYKKAVAASPNNI